MSRDTTKRGIDVDYDGSDPRLCNARTLSGRPCRALKVPGGTHCVTHGGIPGPKTAQWREGRLRVKLVRRVQRVIRRACEFDERHTTKGGAP
ncbi:MAG: hypothetical protein OJF61_001945 [Rhodanobacteraceae bacterium]|nr:MAG: hypothetical protein OJF61_001945 [Rhodanobacteraceae bacterium]